MNIMKYVVILGFIVTVAFGYPKVVQLLDNGVLYPTLVEDRVVDIENKITIIDSGITTNVILDGINFTIVDGIIIDVY